MHALYEGDQEKAQALLPADDELSAQEAAAFGRIDRLRELLDAEPSRANELSPDGFSPLHLAIYGGQPEAVRMLIERGADLEAVSTSKVAQVRPLGTAAFVRSTTLARMLLEAGADPNAKTPSGHTAMDSAIENGDEEFARLLREFGAD